MATNVVDSLSHPPSSAAVQDERRADGIIAASAIAVHLVGALSVAFVSGFPNGFDELQHLSFARWMAQAPALVPHYPVGPIFDPQSLQWTNVPNYLNHPAPYYLLMGWIDGLLGGSVLGLRLVNVALSALAIALMLAGGFRVLRTTTEKALFAAVLVLFPKLAVIGGIVNNDNGALIASGLAFLGLARWTRSPGDSGATALAAIALALAGWTKLTTLLGIGFVLVFTLAPYRSRGGARMSRSGWLMLGAGAAVGIVPTLVNFASYGRAVWHPDAFYVDVSQRVSMGIAGYAGLFLRQMREGWAILEPAPWATQLGLFATLAAAIAVVAGFGASRDNTGARRLCVAYVLALVPLLLLHFWFGWSAFREDGYLGTSQIRYYYVLWPGLALAVPLLPSIASAGRLKLALGFACVLLLIPASAPMAVLRLWAAGWPPVS